MTQFIGINANYKGTALVVINEDGIIEESNIIKPIKSDDVYKQSFDIANRIFCEVYVRKESVVGITKSVISHKSLTAADEGGLHFTIVNRLKFDLKKDVNVISTPSLKHLVTGNLIAINQTMVDALPEHIKVKLMESAHKDFRGLYELTSAYWVAKLLSNR